MQNQEIEKEYLIKGDNKIEGAIEILKHLNEGLQNQEESQKLDFITTQLVEKMAKKGNSAEFMKVVKNNRYKEVEAMLTEGYLGGDQVGDLDYMAFCHLRPYFQLNDKNKKALKVFSQWFATLDAECKEVLDALIQQYGSDKQKQAHEALSAPVVNKKDKKKKEEKPQPKQEIKKAPAEKKKKKEEDDVDQDYLKLFNSQKIIRQVQQDGKISEKERNILITSALPYVNNIPHLGNIIGCVLSADVFSRFARLNGHNSLYVCGTDEYGTATEIKARQEGLTPKQICDKYNKIHNEIYEWFDIDFDCFGRTSTPSQTSIAQEIFLDLLKNDMLEEQVMEQVWCQDCQMFLSDRYVSGTCPVCEDEDAKGDQCDKCGKLLNPTELKNPKCTLCHKQPEKKESNHLFLKLGTLQPRLEQFLKERFENGDWSHNTKTITNTWLKQGLKSRCITRDLKWGTPVPLEKMADKVFYVWFDAPIGYISITAEHLAGWRDWWQNPNKVQMYQFMGKDNVPFHSVIFPSSKIGTEQPWTMVHHINTTEYLNYEHGKFSKSRGTGVFGDNAVHSGINSECFRYYLLINRPEKSDSIFEWNDFQSKINNELMPNVGNLFNRILKLIYAKYDKKVPQVEGEFSLQSLEQHFPDDHAFVVSLHGMLLKYIQGMEAIQIKDSLRYAMEISSFCNKYMQDNQPWAKDIIATGRNKVIIQLMVNALRVVSAVFEPFLPSLSAKMNFTLNLPRSISDETILRRLGEGGAECLLNLVPAGHQINQPVVLVNELSDQLIESLRNKYSGMQAKSE